jgi:hypothetical protein
MKTSSSPIKRFCVYPLALTAALSLAVSAHPRQDTQQIEPSTPTTDLTEDSNNVDRPVPSVARNALFTPKVLGLLGALTLDEKISLVHGALESDATTLGNVGFLPGVPRLGIPVREDNLNGLESLSDSAVIDVSAAGTHLCHPSRSTWILNSTGKVNPLIRKASVFRLSPVVPATSAV